GVGRAPAADGRAARGGHVSFARGPHRQAHAARARAGRGAGESADQEADHAERRRGRAQSARSQRKASRRRAFAGQRVEAPAAMPARKRETRAACEALASGGGAPRESKRMMEPFEYAVKKDVRNNPIVREVDEARQRELWKSVGVAGFLVVVLLFSAWQHFELLRHGSQVEELQRERAAEEEISRRLRLEIETLKSPKRVEALAIG